VLPRGNQNALTELAPEISLHLISCFALTWRLRRRRRPAGLYGRTVHDMNWNGLLASVVAAARLEAARSATWIKRTEGSPHGEDVAIG